MQADSSGFYDAVPVFNRFSGIMDPGRYQPLPDDWILGLADVVQSTKAIAENRYKAVNMAGASVIAAIANALGNREFPFVFGGDGASFAVAPNDAGTARHALAATATWVQEELDLTLRIAMVPVSVIRERGFDLKVARFGASRNVAYAMFSGGGVAFADAAMKRGEFIIPPAPSGTRPDLSGLSCRFSEMPSLRGVIMSLVVMPGVSMNSPAFRSLIEDIVQLVERSPDGSRPVPPGGPSLRWPPKGLELEARATRASGGSLLGRRIFLYGFTGFAYLILKHSIKVGRFIPDVYIQQVVDNSDFRKFDDGLRMVLDCSTALADAIEQRLAAAAKDGVARYGVHRQSSAMMTCFTPSPTDSHHVHFIDGANGGYTLAARALKAAAA
ncbi:MAG: DUF3095 domain-containing protein [Xanthobacteraceae bacterium]